MRTVALLLLLAVLFTSCSVEKKMSRKCARAQRHYELALYKYDCPKKPIDTAYVTETKIITRDTTIFVRVPGDTVKSETRVHDTLGLLNSKVSHLETKYSFSNAWVEGGILKHELIQKDSDIPATIPGAVQHTTTGEKVIVRVPYPVDKPVPAELSWLQKMLIYTGIGFWILVIAYVTYLAVKNKYLIKLITKL